MRHRYRPLGWAAYGVAFLLVFVPLADSLLGVWPPRLGEVTWRFGAVGLVSRAIMTPLLGLLLALMTTVLMEHRRTARVVSVVSFAGAALVLAAVVIFALDALQTRAQIRADALTAFDTATIVAIIKYLLTSLVAVALGIGGWKASRRIPRRIKTRRRVRREEEADPAAEAASEELAGAEQDEPTDPLSGSRTEGGGRAPIR